LNSAKEPAGFKLDAAMDEAWNRLANRGGSPSDLRSVVEFLAKLWAFEQSGPRAFDQWLSGRGMQRKDLTHLLLNEYKARFEQEQEIKLQRTRDLLEGLALGPHSSQFFNSLAGFSSDFKRLAYRTAISLPHNEGVLFALIALSQESSQLAQEWVRDLPNSPVLQTFVAFVEGARLPSALVGKWHVEASGHATPIDRLFHLSTLPLRDLHEELRNTQLTEIEALARFAESLLERASDKGFGKFVRLNLSVYLCIAYPKSRLVDLAIQTLVSTGEPGVAEILAPMGKEYLLTEVHDTNTKHAGRERFLAGLLDAYRKYYSESLHDLMKDLKLLSSAKAPVLAVAARAALAQINPKDGPKFEKFLLRKLQSDKNQSVREWLLRNPEFIRYLRIEKASFKIFQAILEFSKANDPALALQIIEQVLQEPSGPERLRYWEEALRVLANIGGDEADSLFFNFLLQRITDGWDIQIQEVLAKDSPQALFRRSFWKLVESTDSEQIWQVLFASYTKTSEPELVGVLEAAYARKASLAYWILRQYVPLLLETESLSPGFYRSVTNRDLLVAISKQLAQSALESALHLRGLMNEWASVRDAIKTKLLFSVHAGLRIALQSVPDDGLRSRLMKLRVTIEEWTANNSPKLEGSVESIAVSEFPSECRPDKSYVEQFFRGQTGNMNDFTFFAGTNSWAVDVIFGAEQGSWPKAELLLSQIIRSFIFVAHLRKRADAGLKDLPHTVRVQLGVILRETLSDIEGDLAGYFIFRDVLDQIGLHPVMPKLGERVEQGELSSRKHKVIRDLNRSGLLRVFGLGIRVDDMVVSSGTIMKSGDDDDSD
jgi:hypothetical protein